MGSAKKKKEKRKDFVKTKLKVGKTKPKPTAHTELGFKAKSIGLPSQSITKSFTSSESFNHHLSLTKHSSASTRKDALLFLLNHLPTAEKIDSSVFTYIAPLISDQSASVRSTLLTLFKAIPREALAPHIHTISIYIRSGLTHLQEDVRADTAKFLNLILKSSDINIPMQLVTRSWISVLTCFGGLFHWDVQPLTAATTQPTSANSAASAKPAKAGAKNKIGGSVSLEGMKNATGHLEALFSFLKLGLSEHLSDEEKARRDLPLCNSDTAKHLLPVNTTAPYARLGLFSANKAMATEDIGARYILVAPILPDILKTLASGRLEGGEIGRICKQLTDFLVDVQTSIESVQ
ncbi:Rix1 complex component [Myxozyma melibiosi]|uniref:Pre-rRNA-processing protein n=1 Tax=Myxozyma melibiosi TaxID=54550 RepID=A0ABR1FDT0_9ASCO